MLKYNEEFMEEKVCSIIYQSIGLLSFLISAKCMRVFLPSSTQTNLVSRAFSPALLAAIKSSEDEVVTHGQG